jgi:CRP-like cAMP-binding protein
LFDAPAGEVLVREDEPSAGVILLSEGQAVGTRDDRIVTRAGPGALIGEMSVLDGGPCPCTFVARTSVYGWFFERASIEQIRRETSPGAFAFLDQIARAEVRVIRELAERRWGAITPVDAAVWAEARVLGPATGTLEQLGVSEPARLRSLLWQFPRGMAVVRAGEAGNRFLIVTEGRVAITAADGTPLVEVGPGDLPGMLAVLDGGRQPFQYVTYDTTVAAVIDGDRFRELRYGGSALAADLVPRIHGRLVESYRPLLDAMLRDDDETNETIIDTMVDR